MNQRGFSVIILFTVIEILVISAVGYFVITGKAAITSNSYVGILSTTYSQVFF